MSDYRSECPCCGREFVREDWSGFWFLVAGIVLAFATLMAVVFLGGHP